MASVKALKNKFLSISELLAMNIPPGFCEDYLYVAQNFSILGTQFQALKLGTQATTGVFSPLIGWTQERNIGGFSFSNGEITVPETGEYLIDVAVYGDSNTGLEAKLEFYNGTVWADIAGAIDGNPSSAHINGFLVSASLSYKLRVSIRDTGGAMNIDANRARITVGRRA